MSPARMNTSQRIAVIGGGPMGVALAHELGMHGVDVTLYEAEDRLGGLSTWEDFGPFTWDRFYHCVLPTDTDLLEFIRELGLGEELRWQQTATGVYIDGKTYPLDTGMDFARFNALSLWERARLAWTLIRCALVRDMKALEGTTAEEWFVRVGGQRPYDRIWLPLLRAKFGEAADRVSPVFLAAKVKRMLTARSDVSGAENLGYVAGGYRTVWQRAHQVLEESGVSVRLSARVENVLPHGEGARVETSVDEAVFDRVLFTTPFEQAREVTDEWPDGSPVPPSASVDYMGLVCMVMTTHRVVAPHYVLNIADEGFPFTGIIGMTNLVDPAEVGGKSLVYVPKYVVPGDPLLSTSDQEVFDLFIEGMQRIYPDFAAEDIASWHIRRAKIVQPVQGIHYSQKAPQPEFDSGPVSVVNNAQLLETDLNNSRVVAHAREAAQAIMGRASVAEMPPDAQEGALKPDPDCTRFVLPAYNEADGISDLLHRIAEAMRGDDREYHIYVVDDGSSDDTAELASKAAESLPVTLVRHEINKGLGRTLSDGLQAAVGDSRPGDVLVTMDADLTHDPRFVPRMIDEFRTGPDVVVASRFQKGSVTVGVTRFRRILTTGARVFYGTLVPVSGVRDYSCGYRLYDADLIRNAYERLGDEFIAEDGFACMVEILAKLRRVATFSEVPFVLRYDEKRGASQMKILPTIAAYMRVIRRAWTMELSGQLGPRARTSPHAYAMLAGVVAFGVLGQVLLKTGAASLDATGLAETLSATLGSWQIMLGVGSYGVSAMLWLAVLTQMNLSVAYPLGAMSYVLVVGAGWLMGETVPPLRWLGVALIVFGIALIGVGFEMQDRKDI